MDPEERTSESHIVDGPSRLELPWILLKDIFSGSTGTNHGGANRDNGP